MSRAPAWLQEEEDELMAGALESMQRTFAALTACRLRQGYAVTDLQFSLQPAGSGPAAPAGFTTHDNAAAAVVDTAGELPAFVIRASGWASGAVVRFAICLIEALKRQKFYAHKNRRQVCSDRKSYSTARTFQWRDQAANPNPTSQDNRTLPAFAAGGHDDYGEGAVSRRQLDFRLALAEQEAIQGMPNFPERLPVPEREAKVLHSFQLRR